MADSTHDQTPPQIDIYLIGKSERTLLNKNAQDTKSQAVNNADNDPFITLFTNFGKQSNQSILSPPYRPEDLIKITTENGFLLQLIDAMVTNVDRTGHTIQYRGKEIENPEITERLTNIFQTPYPGETMRTLRRKIGWDREQVGYSFIEVIRDDDGEGDIQFLKHIDVTTMRLLSPVGPYTKIVSVVREGEIIELTIPFYNQGYVQRHGSKLIFFKDISSPQHIDKETGVWSDAIPIERRGTEILYVAINQFSGERYGQPRWINNAPAAIGSRQAEENNLDYFKSGGIPPVVFLVEGGTVTETSKQRLDALFSPTRTTQYRGVVAEVLPTSGALGSAGRVSVKVERFGGDQSKDGQFNGYDRRAEQKLASSMRIPLILIGRGESANFATAFAEIMSTEDQVFSPERQDFDTLITNLIIHDILLKNEIEDLSYYFVSNSLNLADVKTKLDAVERAANRKLVSNKDYIAVLNNISGLKMTLAEGIDGADTVNSAERSTDQSSPGQDNPPAIDDENRPTTPLSKVNKHSLLTKSTQARLANLSLRYAKASGYLPTESPMTEGEISTIKQQVRSLSQEDRQQVISLLTQWLYEASDVDHDYIESLHDEALAMLDEE